MVQVVTGLVFRGEWNDLSRWNALHTGRFEDRSFTRAGLGCLGLYVAGSDAFMFGAEAEFLLAATTEGRWDWISYYAGMEQFRRTGSYRQDLRFTDAVAGPYILSTVTLRVMWNFKIRP